MRLPNLRFVLLWLTAGLWLPVLTAFLFAEENDSDAWSQYRGPNRNGISNTQNLATEWPQEGPKQLWKTAIGTGYSTIVVSGNKFYTMFAEDSTEFLACFSESNAAEIWRLPVGKMFTDEFGNGPRSTPAIGNEQVFALGSTGNFFAVDKNSGEILWEKSFPEEFDSKVPRRGFSTSPLVEDDMVIIETGGDEGEAISAFNKENGEMLWSTFDGSPGYSSPVAITINNSRQFIFRNFFRRDTSLKSHVFALSPAGDVIWQHESSGIVIAMPVVVEQDKIFISSSNENGTLFQVLQDESGGFSAKEIWSRPTLKNHFNSSIYHNGYLYGFSNATLKCIDAVTGKPQWAKRGLGKGSLVLADGRLVILSDKGKLVLAEASPERYNEISAFQALIGKSWTMPTVVGGKVYLRNLAEMACYDLRK